MIHIHRSALIPIVAILLAGALSACSPHASRPAEETQSAAASTPSGCPVTACPACPVCPPPKPAAAEASYEPVDWQNLPAWAQGPLATSLRAFVAGCARLQNRAPWPSVCAEARKVGADDEVGARAFFESRFTPYRIVAPDGNPAGLVTGYYEPILKGRREASAGFPYPVYAVPDDLIVIDLAELHPELRNLRLRGRLEGKRLVPYYSRAQIDSPAPPLPAKPLAWVADAVDLFFLQIQGSGQIEFAPGQRARFGFAEQNGHPYRSLGRYLVERGEMSLEQASMQSIKEWAARNPARLRAALNQNPSYVFFRELPPPASADDGPPGALGVALTGGYSIAVDPRYVPLGAPVYLATTWPLSPKPLERLTIAQDTGGAIRGAVRADFFWGTGVEAGEQAGRMRQQGRMWLLWPRGEPLPKFR